MELYSKMKIVFLIILEFGSLKEKSIKTPLWSRHNMMSQGYKNKITWCGL